MTGSCSSAAGAPRIVAALRASLNFDRKFPPLRTGLLIAGPPDLGCEIKKRFLDRQPLAVDAKAVEVPQRAEGEGVGAEVFLCDAF